MTKQEKWLILQDGTSTIGLFEAMFSKNTMTFNPGWDGSANAPADFDVVRAIQEQLKAHGLTLTTEADESTTGAAS